MFILQFLVYFVEEPKSQATLFGRDFTLNCVGMNTESGNAGHENVTNLDVSWEFNGQPIYESVASSKVRNLSFKLI